jgi:hypothetical protein
MFVDPTLADFEERGDVIDGEELVEPFRRRLLGTRGCDYGTCVVSHGVLTSAQGTLHQYNDWSSQIVRRATLSQR